MTAALARRELISGVDADGTEAVTQVLAEGVRLVALEGEPVAGPAHAIHEQLVFGHEFREIFHLFDRRLKKTDAVHAGKIFAALFALWWGWRAVRTRGAPESASNISSRAA